MKQITYFYRNANVGFSIQHVFRTIAYEVSKKHEIEELFMPAKGESLKDIIKNCIYAFRHRNKEGINHITGGVYYLAYFLPINRTTMTVHDIGFFKANSKSKKYLIKRWIYIDLPIRLLNKVTAVSELTKQDLIYYCNINPKKIEVIENPISPNFKFTPKVFNSSIPKILQIGTGWHKNLLNLIKAVPKINCELEIVGDPSDELLKLMTDSGVKFNVEKNLSNDRIIKKYEQSDIVFFASHSEGFGMIILEAQAIGRSVITSNMSPTKEVAGDGAILVDPNNVEDIRCGIEKLINDGKLREQLIIKGKDNVSKFEVDKVVRKYINFYGTFCTISL